MTKLKQEFYKALQNNNLKEAKRLRKIIEQKELSNLTYIKWIKLIN